MIRFSEIINYIFVIGIAQGLFLSTILWRKKENVFANKFLALTILVFSFDLFTEVIALKGFINEIPWLYGLSNSIPYLYGPLVYLYVVFLIHKRESFQLTDLWHFLPFLIFQIYGIFFFYFEGSEYQLSLINQTITAPWHVQLIGLMILPHGLSYLFATIFVIKKFNKTVKDNFSNIEDVDLSWLLYLIVGIMIIWAVVFLSYLLAYFYGKELHADLLIYITISVFLYTFAFKSYKKSEVTKIVTQTDENTSYKKSGLTEEVASRHIQNLHLLMKKEKSYLNDNFNLSLLAQKLNISNHNLSEIINTKLNQNFYDFVNSYRVEEVKSLIKNDRESTYSILAHGFEAGFTSKSAFYSAFKKNTGLTPAQYRKTIL